MISPHPWNMCYRFNVLIFLFQNPVKMSTVKKRGAQAFFNDFEKYRLICCLIFITTGSCYAYNKPCVCDHQHKALIVDSDSLLSIGRLFSGINRHIKDRGHRRRQAAIWLFRGTSDWSQIRCSLVLNGLRWKPPLWRARTREEGVAPAFLSRVDIMDYWLASWGIPSWKRARGHTGRNPVPEIKHNTRFISSLVQPVPEVVFVLRRSERFRGNNSSNTWTPKDFLFASILITATFWLPEHIKPVSQLLPPFEATVCAAEASFVGLGGNRGNSSP